MAFKRHMLYSDLALIPYPLLEVILSFLPSPQECTERLEENWNEEVLLNFGILQQNEQ